MKRSAALFLALVMVCAMFPGEVFADLVWYLDESGNLFAVDEPAVVPEQPQWYVGADGLLYSTEETVSVVQEEQPALSQEVPAEEPAQAEEPFTYISGTAEDSAVFTAYGRFPEGAEMHVTQCDFGGGLMKKVFPAERTEKITEYKAYDVSFTLNGQPYDPGMVPQFTVLPNMQNPLNTLSVSAYSSYVSTVPENEEGIVLSSEQVEELTAAGEEDSIHYVSETFYNLFDIEAEQQGENKLVFWSDKYAPIVIYREGFDFAPVPWVLQADQSVTLSSILETAEIGLGLSDIAEQGIIYLGDPELVELNVHEFDGDWEIRAAQGFTAAQVLKVVFRNGGVLNIELYCEGNEPAPVIENEKETYDDWVEMFQDVELSGSWPRDVVTIAKTQLGYTADEDGYTRYGAWYGNEYGAWDAMFCSFCMAFAGVDREIIPFEQSCERWIEQLQVKELYQPAGNGYSPKAGDIIFLSTGAGIVYDNEPGQIVTIEGGNTVEHRFYLHDDARILGYGEMPAATARVELAEKTIESAPAEDGAVAVVSGKIPDGAVVEIKAVALSAEELIEYFGEEKAAAMSGYVAYDITILEDGEEWQPDDTVSVTIRHPDIQLTGSQTLEVAHVDGTTNEVSVVSSELDENGDINISTEGFSLYIAYTVDFYYNELIYQLKGGESVLLSELFTHLCIKKDVADVTDICISAPDLFEVEKEGSDWRLTSLSSFDTEETLYITFNNETTISIKLTDPPGDPFEPGLIKIKLNLFDWDTSAPLPYVTMGINRQSVAPLGTARGIITLTSDKDGVAYAEIPYTTIGTKTYINGINGNVEIFDSAHPASDYTRFDIDAITGNYNYDISVSGKIRNSVRALHAGAVPKTAVTSAYDDFYFHSGMPANGAYVEFNVYLKDANSGTHTISFDTSTIANASDFTPISINHGQSVNTAGITIPIATNKNLSTLPLLGWTCNGVDFDPASPINHDIVLTPKWASMCTVSFDTSKVSNPTDYPAQHIMGSGYASEPSVEPVNSSDPSRTFLHWSLNGEPFDFENTPITEDIILKPVWEAEGIIHFKIYMWDHEYYVSHGVPGSGDHRADGQTKIPINGVRMVVKTYPGGDGGSEGTPAAADWNNSWNGMIEDYRKSPLGRPGGPGTPLQGVVVNYNKETGLFEGDYVITADQLQYLTPGYVIDTDPDVGQIAEYDRAVTDPNYITGPGIGYHNYTGPSTYGGELTVFDWDWYVAGEDTAGAGNTGVRVIPECKRRGGTITNGTNLNDVAQISQEMIDNGFEFTFVCFVVPAVVVQFDSNGGDRSYPMQKFKPVNSIPIQQQEFKATNPGSPSKEGKVFAGWYEIVGKDDDGNDILDNTPWDFNRIVNHSMTLKAEYTDHLYTVYWKNEDGTVLLEKDEYKYKFGDIPYYDGAIPEKASDDLYDYVFAGWELVNPEGDFTVYPGRKGTSVKSNQVYEARFTETRKMYDLTVEKQVRNGIDEDKNKPFTVEITVTEADESAYNMKELIEGLGKDNVSLKGESLNIVVLTLKHGDEIKIPVPAGSNVVIKEDMTVEDAEIYKPTYKVGAGDETSEQAEINVTEESKVIVFNSRKSTTANLTIKKTVFGAETESEFSFTMTVADSAGGPVDENEFSEKIVKNERVIKVSISEAGDTVSIRMKDGGEFTIPVPVDSKVTITEDSHEGYLTSVKCGTDEKSTDEYIIEPLSEDTTVEFFNTAGSVLPKTGGEGVSRYYATGALLIAGACIYGFIRKRKRERRAA